MKYTLVVCLIAVTLTFVDVQHARAQSPTLRKGVSVQMVTTTHATPFSAADEQDAWVVTVTADGSLYFDADPMTVETLADWMKTHPRNREANLYIKADARTPFASVKAALGPAHSSNFEEVVLLTSQPASRVAGSIVAPSGIDVLLRSPSGPVIQVRLSGTAQGSTLTVNDRRATPQELGSTLKELLHNRAQVVQVEANDTVRFGEIMRVIDEARGAGATVALPTFHAI